MRAITYLPTIFATGATLLFLAGSPLAQAANLASEQDIAGGKALAEKLCARCHAVYKEGKSPNAKAPPFRTFVQKWPLENLEEALAEGIVVGEHIMPEFELSPEKIDRLLAYIGSLSKAVTK